MTKVHELIKRAEQTYYKKLCFEVESEFAKIWMPSHNLEHHKRVWYFAKELLIAYTTFGFLFSYEFVEALMVSVFFHDTGLTRTLDFKHGAESAILAEKFLLKTPDISDKYITELLYAIEQHDNKEYFNISTEQKNTPSIYSILTVADDLDAFGAIGLHRYIEIYFLRGVESKKMIEAIRINLEKRFNFVSKVLLFKNDLHKKHSKRYNTAVDFALSFNNNSMDIITGFIDKKISLETINLVKHIENTQLNNFFICIKNELS